MKESNSANDRRWILQRKNIPPCSLTSIEDFESGHHLLWDSLSITIELSFPRIPISLLADQSLSDGFKGMRTLVGIFDSRFLPVSCQAEVIMKRACIRAPDRLIRDVFVEGILEITGGRLTKIYQTSATQCKCIVRGLRWLGRLEALKNG